MNAPASLGRVTALVALSLCMLAGCTTYYKISDLTSDREYFTTKYKTHDGALNFDDDATGRRINIQNGEVEEIDKDAYRSAVGDD